MCSGVGPNILVWGRLRIRFWRTFRYPYVAITLYGALRHV